MLSITYSTYLSLRTHDHFHSIAVLSMIFLLLLAGPGMALGKVKGSKKEDNVENTYSNSNSNKDIRFTWLPALGSFVPGLVFHGTGHYLAGDTQTASKLRKLEGIGVLAFALGALPIFLSGDSRYIGYPFYALSLGGLSLFASSAFADIYGSISGTRALGSPYVYVPKIDLQLGYAYIYDPQFEYANFVVIGLNARVGSFCFSPYAHLALDDNNQKVRIKVAYRFLGPKLSSHEQESKDGSYLDLDVTCTYHAFTSEGFNVLSYELYLASRYDMGRVSKTLNGSFAEAGVGWGMEFYGYRDADMPIGEDITKLLLAHFGYGIYLGTPGRMYGEAMVYYQHRFDDFAGGIGLSGRIVGFAGHAGIKGFYYVTENWGACLKFEVGSAYIINLGILYCYGKKL
jgi:hypothetical protein